MDEIGDAATGAAAKMIGALHSIEGAMINAKKTAEKTSGPAARSGASTTSGITDGKTTGDLGATSPNSLAGAIKGITPGGRT